MRTFLMLALVSTSLAAQSASAGGFRGDITLGNGNGATSVSLGATRMKAVLNQRLLLGLGLRTTFVAGDLKLTPAGAKNIPAGVIDTLFVASSALMLNVSGHAAVILTSRLQAGLNIDLAGVGAGASRTGSYRASAGAARTTVSASPAGANVFLYGSKDQGSLNSEFFAAWAVNDRFTVRGGLSHQLVEYEAERTLSSNTKRFRSYTNLLFLGVRIAR